MNRIKVQLIRYEGMRLKPYRCTAGKLTIGIGGKLDDCGISQKEAYGLLENDIQNCEKQLLDEIPEIYNPRDEVRKSVLLNMCFNLGIGGLIGFKNTLAFVRDGEWERAANNLLVSRWAKQVGHRAIELSELMRKGSVIPIPVEIDAIMAIFNLPKEMANNGIFKEHQGLILEMIHSLVLQEHYDYATHDDLPEEDPLLISFRHTLNPLQAKSPGNPFLDSVS